jgi:hypothetical protein
MTPLTVGKCSCRYSNALLVSLNNRIYVREKSSAKGEQPSSRIVTLPPLSVSSESGVVHMARELPPSVFKGITQPGEGEEQEKVHGGCCEATFPRLSLNTSIRLIDLA